MNNIKKPLTEFISAQNMRIEHPDTFYAPVKEDLDELTKGNFVRVCTGGERFWVKVTSVKGEEITGMVDNKLILKKSGLVYGDIIQFKKEHVFAILKP